MKKFTQMFLIAALTCATLAQAKSVEDKVKNVIDDAADSLKKGVEKVGDNLEAAQDYLDHYHWKGILQDKITVDPITLKHLQLNGHSNAVVVYPGERIEGSVIGNYNRDNCHALTYYRVMLGFPELGPQTTICNSLGGFSGESVEKFTLIAPKEPGVYQLRFQLTEAYSESGAFETWKDPGATGTIGIIIVK